LTSFSSTFAKAVSFGKGNMRSNNKIMNDLNGCADDLRHAILIFVKIFNNSDRAGNPSAAGNDSGYLSQ